MKPPRTPLQRALGAPFLILGLALGCAGDPVRGPQPAAEAAPLPERVVIFHTNDIHGQVLPRVATWLSDVNPLPDSGGLPRLAATLNQLLAEAEADGIAAFVCDGGDWFQGTPEGQIGRGLGFLGALRLAGHDAAVVGNHEFDHGVDVLLEHLAAAPLPALLANARTEGGERLPGTRDWISVERLGFEVAFVGLLTTSTPSITHAQTKSLRWEDPAEALARVRAELPESVDLVVPVTHIGVEGDLDLARAHPDLPLIVGGHSHTFLRTGVREGATLVAQAGAKASVIGRVDLWLDANGAVVRSEASHIDLYVEPGPEWRNERIDALCADLVAEASERMDEVVGELTGPLEQSRRPLLNTTSGNLIADLIRARARADVAIHNRGGIRAPLEPGPVTRRDLFMILPFDNHVETVTLSGAEVREIFRASIEGERPRTLEFSGATLVVDRDEGQPKLLDVLVAGEPLEPDARVRLATNSFMATGGDGWTVLADAPEREIDFILLRDLIELGLGEGPVTPPTEQRYSFR